MAAIDRLRALEMLLAVVEKGNFTAAAHDLGVTPGAVSKQIARLEEHLGHRLVYRTTRAMSLTWKGEQYIDLCRPLLHKLNAAEEHLDGLDGVFIGKVKISASRVFGRKTILPSLLDFMEPRPQVQVETLFTDRWVDLTAEQVDLCVRIAQEMPDTQLVGKCIGSQSSILVASPTYIQRHGSPQSIHDLKTHQGLMLRTRSAELVWTLAAKSVRPIARLICDDITSLHKAALQGFGIVAIPRDWVQDQLEKGALMEVLPGQLELTRKIWLLRPSRTHTPYLVSLLSQHLETCIQDHLHVKEA